MLSTFLPDGIQLSENETVFVASIDFLESLEELINATSVRTLVNFIIWRMVDRYSGLLGATKKYSSDSSPRSERCFGFTFYNLPVSVNALWVRNFFNRKAKPVVMKLVESIKEEFEKILKTVKWFDKETRTAALMKINNMTSLVGYPEEFFDDEKLMSAYENVTIDEDKLFEVVLELNSLHVYQRFRNLHVPIDKSDWITHSFVAIVNAFYFPAENNIRELII